MLYSYIDRSDSNAGSAEKSQKVHSINYKIGVILQKEIQCLNVEEKNVACSITVSQRIQATRFRNKLARSVELTKHHDKIRSRFTHEEAKQTRNSNGRRGKTGQNEKNKDFDNNIKHESQILNQKSKELIETNNDFSFKKFADYGASKNRPQTALESKTKQWKKNAEAARERVVRAKSAPLKSWRNCSEIMRQLNTSGGGFYVANKLQRPLSRAKFVEIFDVERFREFRAEEIVKEKIKVDALVESLQPLKLEEWHPGMPVLEKRKSIEKITNEKKDNAKFTSFITRVDSIW